MTASIQGLRVLVTGASKGIGNSTARMLAEGGAWVGMVARTRDDLVSAATEVGGTPFVCDLRSPEEVARLASEVAGVIGGPPDVLVNSAGSFALGSFFETSPGTFDDQLAINLKAPFLLTRALLPAMLARRSGHIVNVGSIAARVALPGNSAYSASKFGLHGLHQVLALELRGSGVRATMIEPAATDTPLWNALDPDTRDDLPNRSQMLRPEAVASAIVFAISQPAGVEVSYLALQAGG